jgi:hypothetical protein
MIPKEAITKAKEGGWDPGRQYSPSNWQFVTTRIDFWQTLGKALGPFAKGKGRLHLASPKGVAIADESLDWGRYTAHRFWDLVFQGKPTEKFWKELLTKKQNHGA